MKNKLKSAVAILAIVCIPMLSGCNMKPGTSVASGVAKYLTEEENRRTQEIPDRSIEITVDSSSGEFDVTLLRDANQEFRKFENVVSPWEWKQKARKGWGVTVAATGKNKSAVLTVRILANGKAMETISIATTDKDGFPVTLAMGTVP